VERTLMYTATIIVVENAKQVLLCNSFWDD
jgi:hypothetical protein